MPPIIQEAGVETRGGSPGLRIFMVAIMTHDTWVISSSCSDKVTSLSKA